MTTAGWLPADVEELFGPQATAEETYDVLTVDVPPTAWTAALETARDRLGCTYFDWLSAVDEPGTGFRVAAHVAALSPVRRLLLRTTVPHESPVLPTAVGVYAGAAWHERETHEMFGVVFEGHPALDHLLLPEGFEGHPLRKDFVLAARVAKAWPGAKEPGESDHGGPRRRQMLPPGVPDPNEWGPSKGQLPPAPARPARGAGRTAAAARAAGPAGDRPVRRTRTAAQGSASQESPAAATEETAPAPTPRRARSASEGSASQRATGAPGRPAGPRRARSASEGSASQRATSTGAPEPGDAARGETAPGDAAPDGVAANAPAAAPEETASARSGERAARPRTAAPRATPRSPDAPWHHARPAFVEPESPGAGHQPPPPGAADQPSDRERTERTARPGQPEQTERPGQTERPERTERPEQTQSPARPERPEQTERPEEPAAPKPPEDPREAREGGPQ